MRVKNTSVFYLKWKNFVNVEHAMNCLPRHCHSLFGYSDKWEPELLGCRDFCHLWVLVLPTAVWNGKWGDVKSVFHMVHTLGNWCWCVCGRADVNFTQLSSLVSSASVLASQAALQYPEGSTNFSSHPEWQIQLEKFWVKLLGFGETICFAARLLWWEALQRSQNDSEEAGSKLLLGIWLFFPPTLRAKILSLKTGLEIENLRAEECLWDMWDLCLSHVVRR